MYSLFTNEYNTSIKLFKPALRLFGDFIYTKYIKIT